MTDTHAYTRAHTYKQVNPLLLEEKRRKKWHVDKLETITGQLKNGRKRSYPDQMQSQLID